MGWGGRDEKEVAFNAAVGRQITVLRKRRKLSVERLAVRASLHENTILRYERGGSIAILRLLKVARALGVPLAELLTPALRLVGSSKNKPTASN